jgi:hypothetical protein
VPGYHSRTYTAIAPAWIVNSQISGRATTIDLTVMPLTARYGPSEQADQAGLRSCRCWGVVKCRVRPCGCADACRAG